jgi:addiction module RelE/StbE family toxin
MRLRWTPEAADDLEDISDYLIANWPSRVQSTVKRIYNEVSTLRRFPRMGRETERPGVRALVISMLPYVCVYRLEQDAVVLLHIFHTSQDRDKELH